MNWSVIPEKPICTCGSSVLLALAGGWHGDERVDTASCGRGLRKTRAASCISGGVILRD
jgi:hypothetical protein